MTNVCVISDRVIQAYNKKYRYFVCSHLSLQASFLLLVSNELNDERREKKKDGKGRGGDIYNKRKSRNCLLFWERILIMVCDNKRWQYSIIIYRKKRGRGKKARGDLSVV